jgi:hypothetical protein
VLAACGHVSISCCTRNPLADADVIFPKADMYVISMNPCSAAGTVTAPPRRAVRRAWRPPCRSRVSQRPARCAEHSAGAPVRPLRCAPWMRSAPWFPATSRQFCCSQVRYVQAGSAQAGFPFGPAPLRPASRSGRLRSGRLPARGGSALGGSAGPAAPRPVTSRRGAPRAQAGPPLSPAHGAEIQIS